MIPPLTGLRKGHPHEDDFVNEVMRHNTGMCGFSVTEGLTLSYDIIGNPKEAPMPSRLILLLAFFIANFAYAARYPGSNLARGACAAAFHGVAAAGSESHCPRVLVRRKQ